MVLVAGALLIMFALAMQVAPTPADVAWWFAAFVAVFGAVAAFLWAVSVAGGWLFVRLKMDEPFGRWAGALAGLLAVVLVSRLIGGIDGD